MKRYLVLQLGEGRPHYSIVETRTMSDKTQHLVVYLPDVGVNKAIAHELCDTLNKRAEEAAKQAPVRNGTTIIRQIPIYYPSGPIYEECLSVLGFVELNGDTATIRLAGETEVKRFVDLMKDEDTVMGMTVHRAPKPAVPAEKRSIETVVRRALYDACLDLGKTLSLSEVNRLRAAVVQSLSAEGYEVN